VALTWLTPTGLVAARMLLGYATLLVVARIAWPKTRLAAEDCGRCVLLGAILMAHLLLQNVGLQWTTATNTGWIVGFMPGSIALGSALFLRERLSGRGWLGIALGLCGVLLVCASSGVQFGAAKLGDLLQLSSCVTWTAYTLLAVGPIRRSGAAAMTVWTIGVAAGGTAALALLQMMYQPMTSAAVSARAVCAVVFLGAVCSGAAYALWNKAVRDIGSPATGAYLYIEPFVTLAAARILLAEPFRPLGILGGVVVLAGVWLAAGSRRCVMKASSASGSASERQSDA